MPHMPIGPHNPERRRLQGKSDLEPQPFDIERTKDQMDADLDLSETEPERQPLIEVGGMDLIRVRAYEQLESFVQAAALDQNSLPDKKKNTLERMQLVLRFVYDLLAACPDLKRYLLETNTLVVIDPKTLKVGTDGYGSRVRVVFNAHLNGDEAVDADEHRLGTLYYTSARNRKRVERLATISQTQIVAAFEKSLEIKVSSYEKIALLFHEGIYEPLIELIRRLAK